MTIKIKIHDLESILTLKVKLYSVMSNINKYIYIYNYILFFENYLEYQMDYISGKFSFRLLKHLKMNFDK